MSYTHRIRGECEAFRLLRMIASGTQHQAAQALLEARKMLESFHVPKNTKPVGRPIDAVTVAQLRQIALLDASGGLSQGEIALRVGVKRSNVAHHLRPSKAMMYAMLEAAA